jgi:hypothetical protein
MDTYSNFLAAVTITRRFTKLIDKQISTLKCINSEFLILKTLINCKRIYILTQLVAIQSVDFSVAFFY